MMYDLEIESDKKHINNHITMNLQSIKYNLENQNYVDYIFQIGYLYKQIESGYESRARINYRTSVDKNLIIYVMDKLIKNIPATREEIIDELKTYIYKDLHDIIFDYIY